MKLLWSLSILFAAVSTALPVKGNVRGLIHKLAVTGLPAIAPQGIIRKHDLKPVAGRFSSATDPENLPNRLQRRGGGRNKGSQKRKQSVPPSPQKLRSQRSGSSSHPISSSVSQGSLGVEDKGVSKPIPRGRGERHLGAEHALDLLRSTTARSAGDLRRMSPSKGSNDNLFGWAHQQVPGSIGSAPTTLTQHGTARGFSPPSPLQHHQGFDPLHPQSMHHGFGSAPVMSQLGQVHAGFGSGPVLHNFPKQVRFQGHTTSQGPSNPIQRFGSGVSSGSGTSVNMKGEAPAGRRMQRMNAVDDLTMMDAMPYAEARMQTGNSSPRSSMGYTSSSSGMMSP